MSVKTSHDQMTSNQKNTTKRQIQRTSKTMFMTVMIVKKKFEF